MSSSKYPLNATPAYIKSVKIAESARPMHDGVDTRSKLNSKAAHELRRHNDKASMQKAVELFMENYEMQSALRGSQSTRAMDAYKWAMKTQESYQKVNIRHKARGKIENAARILRDEKIAEKKNAENKKNAEKKNKKE
jgi:hypothetical protein